MTADPHPKRQWSCLLPIKAIGKGRPRFGKGRTFTPEKTVNAEAEMRWLFRMAEPICFTGPVWLTADVTIARPKSVKAGKRPYPTVKPDVDNLLKLIADAGNRILWDDDCQICRVTISKSYGPEDRVEITAGEI